ncbi:hypothetical protein [Streptomyces xantholiticus]|uniref:Uncharacterized protein n=1 Tax=Streptomyces xantholiticus TaxID=68285 RepID=A0ABV1V1G2_9ACTN
MAAEPQKTGIKNADELITLATAYGLTVTVETTDRETLTSYVVRIAIPVPVAYAGTELGRAIAGETMTLLWTKAKKKGARGCLVDATRWSATDHRKVRTLRDVTAAVENLGRDSTKYARDAAPLPDDVVDAPHALYIDGELRKEGIPAERVRTFVSNRRFRGLVTHQDDDQAIVCDNRRYVPQSQAAGTPTPAEERKHVRIVNGGTPEVIPTRAALAEINHAMMDGKRDVREMSEGRGNARIVYRDGRTVELRPLEKGHTPAVQEQRPTVQELTGPIDDALLASYAEMYAAVADGTAIPVRADMVRPGMNVIAAVRLEDRTVGTVTHHNDPGTPWVRITWTTRDHSDSVMGDLRVFPHDHHLMVTVGSIARLYGASLIPAARPAAEILAADPIPAGTSVLEGMPGREIAREELRTPRDVLAHTDYVVQLRDSGAWILPNHDDRADITRGGVAMVQRGMIDNAHGRARTTLDTDGTVYASNGRQAARYIPAALVADYSADFCPGCDTPYATNGDGPCTGGSSTVKEQPAPAAPAPADEAKTRRRAAGFAAKWWAEQHTEEPTNEALRTVFANCMKPPRPELYPAIREAIAAEMPPAAAAPLFTALAAYEAVSDASLSESPRDLHTLACHLETLPLAAPASLHMELRAARDAAEEAWESLRTAEGLTSRTAARDKARAAIEQARAAVLAVEPRAKQMRGTYVPATAEEIRTAARAYMATMGTPDERAAIETGTPSVRVDCRKTLKGEHVFVRITAVVDSPIGRIPAHPPVTLHIPRQDGRLNAADNARKALDNRFRVDVPVEYAGLRQA